MSEGLLNGALGHHRELELGPVVLVANQNQQVLQSLDAVLLQCLGGNDC